MIIKFVIINIKSELKIITLGKENSLRGQSWMRETGTEKSTLEVKMARDKGNERETRRCNLER